MQARQSPHEIATYVEIYRFSTVVASAARHELDNCAYLRDVLERLATGGVTLADLLPDVWAKAHPESVRVFRQQEHQSRADAERLRRQRRRRLTEALLCHNG